MRDFTLKSSESEINLLIKINFYKLIKKHNLTYDEVASSDKIMDSFLIESTVAAFKYIRVPGKYIYDEEIGEMTIKTYH